MSSQANKAELSHSSFPVVNEEYGSVRDERTPPELIKERANCDFNQEEFTKILYGDQLEKHKLYQSIMKEVPKL